MWPKLEFDLNKIQFNTKVITKEIERLGGQVYGVVKVVGGEPNIAKAMLKGGVSGLADSRLSNVIRLRQGGIDSPIILLRSPALSEIAKVVKYIDISLNTEKEVLRALAEEAQKQDKTHKVIIMTDLGDGREGVAPEKLSDLVDYARCLCSISVIGIGTNLTCFSGKPPTLDQLAKLLDLGKGIKQHGDFFISAGTSSALHLIATEQWQETWLRGINHWRIGESIFFGRDIITGKPLLNCFQDACTLHAEVIEIQKKAPSGGTGIRRGIVALGSQELGSGHIYPLDRGVEILGASSDHLVVLLEEDLNVGEVLSFGLDYQALLASSTSSYVDLIFKRISLD